MTRIVLGLMLGLLSPEDAPRSQGRGISLRLASATRLASPSVRGIVVDSDLEVCPGFGDLTPRSGARKSLGDPLEFVGLADLEAQERRRDYCYDHTGDFVLEQRLEIEKMLRIGGVSGYTSPSFRFGR
jgi:hypothetical protein